MKSSRIPASLKKFFWDYQFQRLNWKNDRDLIISRLLSSGDWEAITWLRSQIEDEDLKQWIIDHRGAGLSPQKLRFWELILDISNHRIKSWLKDQGRMIWAERVS